MAVPITQTAPFLEFVKSPSSSSSSGAVAGVKDGSRLKCLAFSGYKAREDEESRGGRTGENWGELDPKTRGKKEQSRGGKKKGARQKKKRQ
jgi:hypothetical protein